MGIVQTRVAEKRRLCPGRASVLERDPETKRCESGSLAEIWRHLGDISVAKLEAHGKTHLKLSDITPPMPTSSSSSGASQASIPSSASKLSQSPTGQGRPKINYSTSVP
ncbi:MAG TPA: hypothetical protein ENN80_04370 [Candidatus Hydrogenedentes bacterium]|nr:hypothetical protein [Candidatus Hydrogenedentota bacterium]